MLGLGHLRLSVALAAQLVADDPDSTALIVTGSPAFGALRVPERVDVMKLPALPVEPGSSWSQTDRRPPSRLMLSVERIHALRGALSSDVVTALDPDVTVVDYLPLGRGGELRAALAQVTAFGGVRALGLWDVEMPRTGCARRAPRSGGSRRSTRARRARADRAACRARWSAGALRADTAGSRWRAPGGADPVCGRCVTGGPHVAARDDYGRIGGRPSSEYRSLSWLAMTCAAKRRS
jgi:hypothetical protein